MHGIARTDLPAVTALSWRLLGSLHVIWGLKMGRICYRLSLQAACRRGGNFTGAAYERNDDIRYSCDVTQSAALGEMAVYAGNKSGNLTTVCRSALKLRERSERWNSVFPRASLPPESLEENGTETGAERARTPDHPRQRRPRGRASWGARPTRTPSPRSPVPRSLRKGPFPSSPPLPRAFIQSVFVGHLPRVRQVAEAGTR